MILVSSKLGESSIHGIGLFSREPIKKGTLVWQFVPGFDLAMTPYRSRSSLKRCKRAIF